MNDGAKSKEPEKGLDTAYTVQQTRENTYVSISKTRGREGSGYPTDTRVQLKTDARNNVDCIAQKNRRSPSVSSRVITVCQGGKVGLQGKRTVLRQP